MAHLASRLAILDKDFEGDQLEGMIGNFENTVTDALADRVIDGPWAIGLNPLGSGRPLERPRSFTNAHLNAFGDVYAAAFGASGPPPRQTRISPSVSYVLSGS